MIRAMIRAMHEMNSDTGALAGTARDPLDLGALVKKIKRWGQELGFAELGVARADISAANRAQVERTYWNAVARSDDALGRLVARLQRLGVWENTLLVVTGDHGESLFEDGFLGHGHIVNDRQFATFLVVNRPFYYVIRDRGTGAVLFLGRVVDPTR